MYFYDLAFDNNKIVFPEYMISQIVILKDDFTIDTTIFDENCYGYLFLGVFATANEYIFAIYNSRVIKKYEKSSGLFVDVRIENLPEESEVRFKHDEVFIQEDKVIIITYGNDILVSDLKFTDIRYVKNIYKGKPHMQIIEDKEFLYIPIEKTIFCISKKNLSISIYAQLNQIVDVLFKNKNDMWILTNDAKLTNLDIGGECIDLSTYMHFYGNRENGQICNYINAYCYKEEVLLIPCYCDNLLHFNMIENQITEMVIEREKENSITLNRVDRKNVQKYIASCQKDQYVFLLSSSSEILYLFDFETRLLSECPRGINSRSLMEIESKHKKILKESCNGMNLANYIECIINK